MTPRFRAMDQAGTSGAVFDSNSFDTNSFDINSWDFGELVVVQEENPIGGAMWGHEEPRFNDDDRVIMAVIKEFLQIIH